MMLTRRERTPLRKLMLLGAMAGAGALVEDTATGNPLTFITDVSKPLKSLLIPFTPQQSGTGDPSPQNIRPIVPWNKLKVWCGGFNLIDLSKLTDGLWWNGIINTASSYIANYRATEKIPVKPGATYYVSRNSGAQNYCSFFGKDGAYLRQTGISSNGQSVTMGDDVYFIGITIGKDYTDTALLKFGGTYDQSDYETGKPITETDITFPAFGKNLLNPATIEQGGIASGGAEYASNTRVRSGYIPIIAGTKYTLSASSVQPGGMHFYDANKGNIGANTGSTGVTAPENAAFVRCFFKKANDADIAPSDVTDGQLEASATATAYEPFTNTIYGGTLDVVSGVLTVECVKALIKDFEWSYNDAYGYMQSFSIVDVVKKATSASTPIDGLVCDSYTNRSAAAAGSGAVNNTVAVGLYGELRIRDNNYSDASTFVTAMGESVIVYPLATPQTVTLTPQQITALVGDNTIWSDADGSMTAVYLKKK